MFDLTDMEQVWMGLCLGSKVLEAVICTKAPMSMAGRDGVCKMSRGSGLRTYEQHVTEDQVMSWIEDNVGRLQGWDGVLKVD